MKSQPCAAIWKHITLFVISSACRLIFLTFFQEAYCNWAKCANYESKLPGDVKKCKADAKQATWTLDRDLTEKKMSEQVTPYSNKLFWQVAIEWLISTDQVGPFLTHVIIIQFSPQPIQALNHLKWLTSPPVQRKVLRFLARRQPKVKLRGCSKITLCNWRLISMWDGHFLAHLLLFSS